jgi:hypothetical protein
VEYELSTDKPNDQNIKALESELTYPRFDTPYWKDQINLMLKIGKKAEPQISIKKFDGNRNDGFNIKDEYNKIMNGEEDYLKTLSKDGANIKNILTYIKSIDKLTENDPINNFHKIKKDMIGIEKTLNQSRLDGFIKEGIEQHLQPIKEKIPEWEDSVHKSFGLKLEESLRQSGFELEGHYPNLKVLLYTLEVNLENNTVAIWFGPLQEKLKTCKLVPEDIVEKLKDIHNKNTQQRYDDKTFSSYLYEAYKIASYRNKLKIGEQVKIRDILSEFAFLIQDITFKTNPIKNRYKDYGSVFFAYDLYRLKERNKENHEINMITATRAFTARRADFLWIPSNEKGDGNYISHIKFREL